MARYDKVRLVLQLNGIKKWQWTEALHALSDFAFLSRGDSLAEKRMIVAFLLSGYSEKMFNT